MKENSGAPRNPEQARDSKLYIALSILLLIIAGSLRFYDLPGRSMWIDEAASALYSQGTLADTLDNTRQKNTAPIVYPLILQAIQKFHISATSVRLPSAIFSLLAVAVMLLLPRTGTHRVTAFFAASALTLSTSQVHWAQSAREYSLAVLLAALMLYGLLAFLGSNGKQRKILYATLFAAPLIQYGLVLFGFAVIGTLGAVGLLQKKAVIPDILKAGIALSAGGLISLLLTLRFQMGAYAFEHLGAYFYQDSLANIPALVRFIASNTYSVLKFLLPGSGFLWLFVVIMLASIVLIAIRRFDFNSPQSRSIAELLPMIFALTISIVAVLLNQYPYGAAHQCLYLAPAVALGFGTMVSWLNALISEQQRGALMVIIAMLTFGSGAWSLLNQSPYAEVEDIKSVISELQPLDGDMTPVYVYPSAVPAFKFYGIEHKRLQFGEIYPQFDPDGYRQELNTAMNSGDGELLIVLSSVVPAVEEFIINEIPENWVTEKKLGAAKSALYLVSKPADPDLP